MLRVRVVGSVLGNGYRSFGVRYDGIMVVRFHGVLLLAAAASWAQRPTASGEPVPFPLGVAVPANGAAYLHAPGRGLLQVDLSSGRVVRSWPVDAEPAGFAGGRLVAVQTGSDPQRLVILFLQAGAAEPARKLDVTITEPVSVRDPRFHYQARLTGNTLRVDWSMDPPAAAGAPALQRANAQQAEARSGALVVDLVAGKPTAPATDPIAQAVRRKSFPYQRHYPTWSTDSWNCGSTTAWLGEETDGSQRTVFLVTEPDGDRDRLPLVAATEPFAFVTLDGCAVLILAAPPERAQVWTAFSVEKRARIGQLGFAPGVREVTAIRSRVYWLGAVTGQHDELTLYAADLASGARLWQLAVGSAPSVIRQTRRQ